MNLRGKANSGDEDVQNMTMETGGFSALEEEPMEYEKAKDHESI